MKRSRNWALGVVLVIAVALLVLPAIVLAGRDFEHTECVSTTRRPVPHRLQPKTFAPIDAPRFRHKGCSKRADRFETSSL